MRKNYFFMTIIAVTLFMFGCQANDADNGGDIEAAEAGSEMTNNEEAESNDLFPVTVESTNGPVEIKEKPKRILPLSLDVTEIVLELVDPSKVVAISKSVEDEQLSTQVDKADAIEQRVSSAVHIDLEEILSFDTDLLLLTKMHGQEEDANEVLSGVGLPIVTFNTMGTVDAFMDNVKIIGDAVGEPDKAANLIARMKADIEKIQKKIPTDAAVPSVLVLSEVGPGTGPFMMGPGNISYDLIQLAGATPAVDGINLESSTPASIEQVLKMDPDYIFLLDFVGKGDEVFDELSENPGWDTLQAIENGNTKVLDVKYLMNPNTKVVKGLEIMVDWIYELEEN